MKFSSVCECNGATYYEQRTKLLVLIKQLQKASLLIDIAVLMLITNGQHLFLRENEAI